MVELLLAYGFVFLVIGMASLLDKLGFLNDEGSRKFIHIGVSNWWLVAMVLFEPSTYYLAVIPPFTFIVLNYLSYRFDLIQSMERKEKSLSDLGTVYYAISLFIITFFAFYYDHLQIGALAILSMGYGDGLGAIVGKHFNSKKLYGHKSLLGSLTMFISTFIIGILLFPSSIVIVIFISIIATLIELFTPKGLDNLSVPLLIFFLGLLLL
ncbi:MAG: diacylglycerol/polyprenol kinase family protein [Candidatus Izemoplasmataceae bacterium]